MVETYSVGSYWLARSESAEACALRAEALFRLLERCDPAWAHWHEAADSFAEARERPFTPDAATFTHLFGRKENRMGDGFHYGLWAGERPEETSSLSGACGSADPWQPSVCLLKPPHQGPTAQRVLTASVLTETLRAMALAWEPEWGVVTSRQYQDRAYGDSDPDTFVGWVTYFSRLRGTVPPLPAPVRIEPVEDKGTLVILTPERFTASNAEHIALAARVHALLDRAGLLRPLQPLGSQ
jgi:hypothetical protein